MIDVNIDSNVLNKVYLPYLKKQDTRYEIYYGGASSGKSVFVSQKKVYQHLTAPGHKTLVVRRYKSTVRGSVFAEIRNTIYDWKLQPIFHIPKGKQDFDIQCKANGNEFIFTGLDDVEKLKSIQGITDIWFEEANEGTFEDFLQLDLRMRGRRKVRKTFTLTFNPVSALSWLKKHFFDKVFPNTTILKTTYLDNLRFIDAEDRQVIEGLKEEDYIYYMIYALGEWGTARALIYSNYVVEDFEAGIKDYDIHNYYDQLFAGIDYGFNHPAAFILMGIKDQVIYDIDEVYETHLTNPEFIEAVKELFHKYQLQYWDVPAWSDHELDRIEEFNQEQFDVQLAEKKVLVRNQIDFIKRLKHRIHPRCVNTIKEKQGYKWREDRDGNVRDEPAKYRDDAMDAERYGIYSLFCENDDYFHKVKTQKDIIFGGRSMSGAIKFGN